MAYITPKSISAPKAPQINYWPSNPVLLNGGLNLTDKEWKISDNQASKALNVWFKDGELGKRFGQAYVNEDIGTVIYNAYRFKYEGKIVFHSGTKLYTLDTDTGTTKVIYEGLTANKGSFFKFNQKLYYVNGTKFIQYDGGEYANLLGADGNCNDTSKFTATTCTIALDSDKKQEGNYGFEVTLTAATGTVKRTLPQMSESKYYMITAYLKNGSCQITMKKDTTGGGTELIAPDIPDITENFTRTGVLTKPTEFKNGDNIVITLTGTSTDYAYMDSVMVNEITLEEYNLGLTECMNKYPYTDKQGVIEVNPYIPTVTINRTPTGGGDVNEDYNRIGKGFKNSFNGNGSAVAYQLTDTDLDKTKVTVTVGGVTKVEGTDFSVNRITGLVTFNSAPASGQNNVIITAYKTDQDAINSILKCKYAISFGGQNDNRMFFAGNGTGYFYYTGITTSGIDATYFPYNNYNIIGNPDEDITGFGKQYDTLCIFKGREIYGETYTWNGTQGIFNTFPVNSQIGCDCPNTIQTINNQLTWLNTYGGVYTLVGTAVQSQRNVMPISRNINPRLLADSNLNLATSIEIKGKYWLCVNNKVYLWDYFISPYVSTGNPEESAKALSWWYFDNINAGAWITDGQDLYYSDRSLGRVVKFHREYDNQQFYDFGNEINAIYRIPLRDLGMGLYEFDVLECWIDCRGDTRTGITVTYITSDNINGDPATDEIQLGSFSYDTFSYDTFTYQIMGYKETFPLSPMEKKIDLFGIELSNTDGGRDMNISSVMYSYRLGKKK